MNKFKKFINDRKDYIFISIIIFVFLMTLVIIREISLSARIDASKKFVSLGESPASLLKNWLESGVTNKALIQFSDHLAILKVEETNIIKIKNENKNIDRYADSKNYLYIASRMKIIRKIYAVISDDKWKIIKKRFENGESDVFRLQGDFLVGYIEGVPVVSGPLSSFNFESEKYLVNIEPYDISSLDLTIKKIEQMNLDFDMLTVINKNG